MSSHEGDKLASKCHVEMHDREECGREVYDQEGKCICHSVRSDKDRLAFQCEIEAMLEQEDYDFTRFVFTDHASFAGRTFEGPVWFERAQFLGGADFTGATFRDTVRFVNASFEEWAIFAGTMFESDVHFENGTFQCPVLFVGARFQDAAQFALAKFQGAADFNGARFKAAAGFLWARFEKDVYFNGTWFENKAVFSNVLFERGAAFVGQMTNYVKNGVVVRVDEKRVFSSKADTYFKFARFQQPEKVVFQSVFLGRTRFLGTDLRGVDFTDVEWSKRSSDHFAVWDELAPGEEEKDYALIGKLYRQLKHNYEEQRDPITAGDAAALGPAEKLVLVFPETQPFVPCALPMDQQIRGGLPPGAGVDCGRDPCLCGTLRFHSRFCSPD